MRDSARSAATETGAGVTLRTVREHFPGLQGKTFLDAACVGLAPADAQRAIERFLERTVMCPERDASTHHIELDEARATAVREGARLLDADASEIALVESTTHGLNVIAAAIPFAPDENVVICDLEHVLRLTDRLHEELPRLGVRVVTRTGRDARSGITKFEVSDSATDNEAFLQALLDEHVYVALRYTSGVGGIRISTHFYNDDEDLDRLLRTMGRLLRHASPRP